MRLRSWSRNDRAKVATQREHVVHMNVEAIWLGYPFHTIHTIRFEHIVQVLRQVILGHTRWNVSYLGLYVVHVGYGRFFSFFR